MSAKKTPPKTPPADAPTLSQIRIAALRLFKVTYLDRDNQPCVERVMAHLVNFPHPREVTFHDISIEGNIALQYLRRSIYNWVDVIEETPVNDGSAQVQ